MVFAPVAQGSILIYICSWCQDFFHTYNKWSIDG